MTYETVLLDVAEDGVATITLNRPDVHNALNQQMVDDLHAALGALEARDDLRGLVITSAGGKAFMSGADIAELRERGREDALKGINSTLFARIEEFPRPVVAAIRGWCLGGGCELALSCDFRVAGEGAKFGQPEVGLGIMAAAGGTRRLPALVGLSHARRLLFSGQIIDAEEAARIGLVDRVVSDDAVLEAARELLAPILKQSPEAVRRTKEAMLAWIHNREEETLRKRDDRIQGDLFEHPEKFERMDAFLARREARKKQ
ncbi:MAG: enoyl-CoA hydratase/isomerase family protein [Planctomycetota bacterium]|jgi:enoyl-CoA hydratase